jgi:hypothetical protein
MGLAISPFHQELRALLFLDMAALVILDKMELMAKVVLLKA